MAGKEQFDEFLGGTERLPTQVHIMKLISSRASEIAAMSYSIENPQQTKLVFQKLPVYMRRRIMSHNAKRLPRRLREAHLNQMTKSGLPPKSKRPSRKYRRRPRNLLAEYNRRQRNKVWLETHIWHAKRFHMTEKWGFKIANHANDKCFRTNYRAVARNCLMQDISYYTCVELNGPEEILKDTLRSHCNPGGLTFAAKIFITGIREGTVMFFKKNGYPRLPLGHVHFLWRPGQCRLRRIWIWVHPSFLDDFIAEIVSSFEFRSNENAVPHQYSNDKSCNMCIHKNTLNRFRFYGPLTINILMKALHLPKLDRNFITSHENLMQSDENRMECEEEAQKFWHVDYYNNKEHIESLRIQQQVWHMLKMLQCPSQLPPNIVLGFTVLDPRFHLPPKRTKPQKEVEETKLMPVPPTNANASPIWEAEIRKRVSKEYVNTSAINKLRSQCLVPGVDNDRYFNEGIMTKIPILLIQKSGTGDASSCIDIVLPASWAMPFWLACIFRCARVGALRESKSIAFESGNLQSPDINEPDTPAYAREALITKSELKEKYFRYPPNRRVNFTKLGISSPFFCEWKLLMKEWTGTDDFVVLRDRNLLQLLQESLQTQETKRRKYNKLRSRESNLSVQNAFEDKDCLVRVKVSILRKGRPRRFAIICMPKQEDVDKLQQNRNWSGPVEKLNSDPNEATRKTLRKNHLVQLKRLRRQRIRHKKSLTSNLNKLLGKDFRLADFEKKSKDLLMLSRAIVYKQSKNMTQLYLPDCTKVRNSCDREIMGYITMGDFSFTEAKGVGLGYVTLSALMELIDKKWNFILVRNIQTRQYRIAKLDIII